MGRGWCVYGYTGIDILNEPLFVFGCFLLQSCNWRNWWGSGCQLGSKQYPCWSIECCCLLKKVWKTKFWMDLKTYMYFYVQQCVQTVTGEGCWQNIDFGAFNFCRLVRCSSLRVDAETLKADLVDQNTCTDSTFTCMHSTQLASVPQWKLNLYNKGVFLSEHQRLNEDFMSQRGQCESVSSILYSRLWIEKEQCYIAILQSFCDHCSKPALLKKNPQLYSATRPSLWSMPSM